MHVLEFIAQLAKSLRPRSILDPWVEETPTILAAAAEASGSAESCGLVWNERLRQAALAITPLDGHHVDLQLGFEDHSDRQFDLVLVAHPVGVRLAFLRKPEDPRGRFDDADVLLWRVAKAVATGGHVLFQTGDNFFSSPTRRRFWTLLAQRGLYPQSVVSLDQALAPLPSIATSLVLFGREPSRQL